MPGTATPAGLTIRPFEGTEEDYQVWADIRSRTTPDYARTVEEIKRWDAQQNKEHVRERFIAEIDSKAVGIAVYDQNPWTYHPQKFEMDLYVPPEWQGKGVGAALYQRILERLDAHNALALRCKLREDWERSHRFARDRGFVEDFREWESRLKVETFDFAPFADRYSEPLNHGIVIKTVREWKEELPDLYEAWYEMDKLATADVPSPEPITFLPFDRWKKWFDDNPNILWDAIFLARDEKSGEIAGVTSLWKRERDTDLETGFTGVHPGHRRKGIAFALKLRAIEYARSVNCAIIRTDNASINRPMLSINEALGFEKQPAWISLVKTFANAPQG